MPERFDLWSARNLPVFPLRRHADLGTIGSTGASPLSLLSDGPAGAAQDWNATAVRYPFTGGFAEIDRLTGAWWGIRDSLWELPLDFAAVSDAQSSLREVESRVGLFSSAARFLRSVSVATPPTTGATITTTPVWSRRAVAEEWTRRTGSNPPTGTRVKVDLNTVVASSMVLAVPGFGLSGIPVRGRGCHLSLRISHREGRIGGLNLGVPSLADTPPRVVLGKSRQEILEDVRREYLNAEAILCSGELEYRVVILDPESSWLVPHWALQVRAVLAGRDWELKSLAIPAVPGFEPRASGTGTPPAFVTPAATGGSCHISMLGRAGGGLSGTAEILRKASAHLGAWTVQQFADLQAQSSNWRGANAPINSDDLALYIGHADASEISLFSSDARTSSMALRECEFGGRLKWVILDACGVLQHPRSGSFGSAFDRHVGTFHGLRSLLGFATNQYQNVNQLPQAVEYATKGDRLMEAWFQACCQHQGAGTSSGKTAVAAAMLGVDGGITSRGDALTAGGLKAPAMAANPDRLVGIWTPVA